MGADDLLSALLRSLQIPDARQGPQSYLGAVLSLLLSLNNPHNVTLLTSQLLTAPALWSVRHDSTLSLSIISLFSTAILRIAQRTSSHARLRPAVDPDPLGLELERWTVAVMHGLDTRSHPARHVLVLAGLLVGLAAEARHHLTATHLRTLHTTFITAINTATEDSSLDQQSQTGLVLALTHVFQWLTPDQIARLDHDRLLSLLSHALWHSSDGLDSLGVLRRVDQDVYQIGPTQFSWVDESPSFRHVQAISSSPTFRVLGPLARLVAHTLEHVRDATLVLATVEELRDFATTLQSRWYANRLSEVDPVEEAIFLSPRTVDHTLPVLSAVFKSTLFAAVIVLNGAMSRLLNDRTIATSFVSPRLAQHTLVTLRHLNFILSRLGATTLSQYDFVHRAAIDILAAHPVQAEDLLRSISPSQLGRIPSHPLDREDDLFFFNTTEHMTLFLSTPMTEILVRATEPYLTSTGHAGLTRSFEAAHSLMLAVFSAPQNSTITIERISDYIGILQQSVFRTITSRQFRLAFRTLVRIAAAPGPIMASCPDLSSLLVQMLYDGASLADESVLVASGTSNGTSAGISDSTTTLEEPASRKALYIYSITDSLAYLPETEMEEWLGLLGRLIQCAQPDLRRQCAEHVWRSIFAGGMDGQRAFECAIWWMSSGGKEMCFGPDVLSHTGLGRVDFNTNDEKGQRRINRDMRGALPGSGPRL